MPDTVQSNLIQPITDIYAKFDDYYNAYNAFETCIEQQGVTASVALNESTGNYEGKNANGTVIVTYNPSNQQYGSNTTCGVNAGALNTNYAALNSALITLKTTNISSSTVGLIDASFDDPTKFQQYYQDMQTTRSNLDLKLEQLYQIQNSLPSMSERSVDSIILASILWIVLASALIYYIFIGNMFNFSRSSSDENDAGANAGGGFMSYIPYFFKKT